LSKPIPTELLTQAELLVVSRLFVGLIDELAKKGFTLPSFVSDCIEDIRPREAGELCFKRYMDEYTKEYIGLFGTGFDPKLRFNETRKYSTTRSHYIDKMVSSDLRKTYNYGTSIDGLFQVQFDLNKVLYDTYGFRDYDGLKKHMLELKSMVGSEIQQHADDIAVIGAGERTLRKSRYIELIRKAYEGTGFSTLNYDAATDCLSCRRRITDRLFLHIEHTDYCGFSKSHNKSWPMHVWLSSEIEQRLTGMESSPSSLYIPIESFVPYFWQYLNHDGLGHWDRLIFALLAISNLVKIFDERILSPQ